MYEQDLEKKNKTNRSFFFYCSYSWHLYVPGCYQRCCLAAAKIPKLGRPVMTVAWNVKLLLITFQNLLIGVDINLYSKQGWWKKNRYMIELFVLHKCSWFKFRYPQSLLNCRYVHKLNYIEFLCKIWFIFSYHP